MQAKDTEDDTKEVLHTTNLHSSAVGCKAFILMKACCDLVHVFVNELQGACGASSAIMYRLRNSEDEASAW